jgi:citrate synthase
VKNWEDEGEVSSYLTKLIRKEAFDGSGLIYGLGHAVYTVSDPRAILLKQKATELASQKGMEDELNLYFNIERLAPEVFASEKSGSKIISANVDFYSGFVYKMLNIPAELYTPIFAVSRMAGWAAHVIEEIVSGGRIMRPAYKSVAGKREYVPLNER